MPTPSPIIVARVGATSGMATKWPIRPTRPSPVISPTMAVTTGMPAAARQPKVNARMMTAEIRPMASLRRDLVSDSRSPTAPPASTWIPALRAGSAAAKTLLATVRVSWPPLTSRSTWATAVVPSALRNDLPAGENGLMTADTLAVRSIAATDASTARFCAGSVSLPLRARKTIGLRPFCCGGNSRLRRSDAFCAPVPGSLMSLLVRIPKASTPATTLAKTSAQISSTRYLRLTHSTPRR